MRLLLADLREHLRDGERLELFIGEDVNGAVRADRHRKAQRVDALQGPHGHGDDFVGLAGLAKTNGLFHGDFVKGIDRHLGDLGVDVRMVGKRADLHFGVHHAFDSHKDFHN